MNETQDRCEVLEQLCRDRARGERGSCVTWWIGDTRRCFERQQAFGVCDQNNLKINDLRRGRSPSGCIHFPSNLSGHRIDMSLAGRPFLLKFMLPLAGDCAPGGSGMVRRTASTAVQVLIQYCTKAAASASGQKDSFYFAAAACSI